MSNTTARPLRLAMLGMIDGNGHPYSWAAIINGYNREAMAECPYPVIPVYLGAEPYEEVRIPGAQVTHIWTDKIEEARHVARCSNIPNVVERMEEVIGHVDAVVITTDDGSEHVWRAKPFIEAGLPVFIDKPLASTVEELRQFIDWHKAGARLLSSSGMRYAPAWKPLAGRPWKWVSATTIKTWEKYGIHAFEPLYGILGPGFETVTAEAQGGSTLVSATHRSGAKATVAVLPDAYKSFGVIHAYGAETHESVHLQGTYPAFRGQMLAMVEWLQSGVDPYPFAETIEQMAVIIAGIRSRDEGRPVPVKEILAEVNADLPSHS